MTGSLRLTNACEVFKELGVESRGQLGRVMPERSTDRLG
jgi:hypothetical protein